MVDKVNGFSAPTEAVGADGEFFTVNTLVNIAPTGVTMSAADANPSASYPFTFNGVVYTSAGAFNAAKASQDAFNAVVRAVQLRSNLIILGGVSSQVLAGAFAGVPAAVAGNTLYTMRFATSTAKAWDNASKSIAEELHGLNGFVFTIPTTANNLQVVKADTI